MVQLHAGWNAVRLIDAPTGAILVNTEVPLGTASTLVDANWVRSVRETKRPVFSNARQDPASGRFFVNIAVPVMRRNALKYVLGARLQAATFGETLRRQSTPPGGVVTLLDAQPIIIARSRNESLYLGKPPRSEFIEQVRTSPEGSWPSTLLEGTPAYSAHSKSPLTGWTVGIGLPSDAIDAPIRRSFMWLVAVGSTIVAGGIMFAVLVRRRIVRSQTAAAAAARALAAGDVVALSQSSVIEFDDLSRGLREAAAILERRLHERNEAERQRERARAELQQALASEKNARAAGEKNEARLAVTLRSIGDAVITTDADGLVTMLNPVAQGMTGWTEADAIGEPIDRVFITVEEETRHPRQGRFVSIQQQAAIATVSSSGILVGRDGREIPVADSTAAILTPDGALLGAVVVFRDVTAEREADRQRAALLNREQAARRAAEALNRAKDEFVATVSHELRTPLNAIFGWVAMLRAQTLDQERQRHALNVIHRNTLAQAQLIEDLLDMSRVIRGTVRLDMQPMDLAVALEAAVDTLRPTADARHITIGVRVDRGTAIVSGDQGRLQQVIWNLLSNSLKFSTAGGRVDARLEVSGDEAVLHVTDSGEGIAPEFLPHVFDRFRQETATVTRTHSGLGIGLSLVRHLTELHGGTVAAASAGKGEGATFTIRLPLLGTRTTARSTHQERRAAGLPDLGPLPLHGRRLIVVDDDEDARDLIATAMTHAGADAIATESVGQALAAIAAQPPDAVITDIAMPNATGFDLVRQLRGNRDTAELPVIAITAYNRGEDRERALAEGFDAHVGKPFDPRTIVALIAGLINEREGSPEPDPRRR
jgi:PAS domain S-box-containing protein